MIIMTQLHGKQALTYDDIQLIPAYSDIESRQNIDDDNIYQNHNHKI